MVRILYIANHQQHIVESIQNTYLSQIWDFYSDQDSGCGLLGYDTM
jgi:hypothetical protein